MENTGPRSARLAFIGQLYTFETEQFWDRAVGLFVTVNAAFIYLLVSAIFMRRDPKTSAIEAASIAALLTLALPLVQVRLASALQWFPIPHENESRHSFRLFIELAGFVSLACSGAIAGLAIFTGNESLDAVKRHFFEGTVFIVILLRFLGPISDHMRERRARKARNEQPGQ
jgi:ABC-type Fe3+ transport system permease subunit